ncbi:MULTISPECIES: glycerophosphodiester phosphodiesterase family protein [Pelosinus]|uniref:Glycerophosphoryl diester phosphodiesterase n=1 Tax=Pelosinus fermentans B4 TaxID=1149862 RepID=I8RH82_9FIRM|nr:MULTISPECIES: glycerophosphodiester phosphodiesterase family protein [Pelosinus]EIW19063.1 glycerophosphoryl diester phosphodiesterase [Pelosinus fermentans B4]EIW21727.1 glycerophosphoryl diester phosphodiesterase [Pelosinus fermentans A11]OAM95425.1 glycerophosphoryl diester phosphodiesterase [Pelosinus fermentans DSM 17108]
MLIYAHRGARSYAPENTMSAFRQAIICKADGIELDVQATKDHQLVICHDHTIDRTSNGSGWIKDLTLAQLKSFDFGSWFAPSFANEAILTFQEFFAWYVTTPLLLNIEIKNGPVIYKGIEEQLINIMKANKNTPQDFDLYNRIIISSFYHPSLVKINK